ncbi:hypothetical protein C8J56DRAFT_1159767 [Mycena floridula]|nr:hypothetical protein C8J56DRAFT_1159767 [Mycena floridula]
MTSGRQSAKEHPMRRYFETVGNSREEVCCRRCGRWRHNRKRFVKHLEHLESCLKDRSEFIELCKEEEDWYRQQAVKPSPYGRERSVVTQLLSSHGLQTIHDAAWFSEYFPSFAVQGTTTSTFRAQPSFYTSSAAVPFLDRVKEHPEHPLFTEMVEWAALCDHNDPDAQRLGEDLLQYVLERPEIIADTSSCTMEITWNPKPTVSDVEADLRLTAKAGFMVSAFDIHTGSKSQTSAVDSIIANMNVPLSTAWTPGSFRSGVIEVISHPLGTGAYPFEFSDDDPALRFKTIGQSVDGNNSIKLLGRRGETLQETKDRLFITSTLTPAGNVSLFHVDGFFGDEISHIDGRKIWFKVPMTELNWGFWKAQHPVVFKGCVDLLKKLEGVQVFTVERPCRFKLEPFDMHLVISLTKAAHAGVPFYPTCNLIEYLSQLRRVLALVIELGNDIRQDPRVRLICQDFMAETPALLSAVGDDPEAVKEVKDIHDKAMEVYKSLSKIISTRD